MIDPRRRQAANQLPNRRSQTPSRLNPQWNLAPCPRLTPRWTRLVLDRLPSLSHPLGFAIEASLHCINDILVFPAPHAPVREVGALRFDRALLAVRGPVGVCGQAGFQVRVPIDQALARGTAVLVLLRHIDEVLLAVAPVGLLLDVSGLGT